MPTEYVEGLAIGEKTIVLRPDAPPLWNNILMNAAAVEPVMMALDAQIPNPDMATGMNTPDFLKQAWGVVEWKQWPDYPSMRRAYIAAGDEFMARYNEGDFQTEGTPGVGMLQLAIIAVGLVVIAAIAAYVVHEYEKTPTERNADAIKDLPPEKAKDVLQSTINDAKSIGMSKSTSLERILGAGTDFLKWGIIAVVAFFGFKWLTGRK